MRMPSGQDLEGADELELKAKTGWVFSGFC